MKKSKFSEEQIATAKTTAEEVQRALSLVKNSPPLLGTGAEQGWKNGHNSC